MEFIPRMQQFFNIYKSVGIVKNKIHMIERCSTSLSEICKSKLQWSITTYLSQWPSSKCLQTIKAGRGVREKGTLLHRWKHKLVHPLGRTIWRFHKELKIITTWPRNFTPQHISRENSDSNIYMHPSVHCITIYNCEDMKVNGFICSLYNKY